MCEIVDRSFLKGDMGLNNAKSGFIDRKQIIFISVLDPKLVVILQVRMDAFQAMANIALSAPKVGLFES